MPSNQIYSLYVDKDGIVWVGTTRGLCRFNGREFESFNRLKTNLIAEINGIESSLDGKGLLLASNLGLYEFSGSTFKKQSLGSKIAETNVTFIKRHKDTWFISTAKGLGYFRKGKFEHIFNDGSDYGFIGVQPFKNRYLLLNNSGYCYSYNIESKQFTENIEVNGNIITAFEKDKTGKYWLGTPSGVLIWEGPGSKPFQPGNEAKVHNLEIRCLFADANNNVWLGSSVSLLKFLSERFSYLNTETGFPADKALCIASAKNNDVFVGTDRGLVVVNKQGYQVIDINNGLPDNYINEIAIAKDGKIWVATDGGISILSLKGREYRIEKTYKADEVGKINSICFDNANVLLAGFDGYVFNLGPEGLTETPIATGDQAISFKNNVIRIAPDGSILLGTTEGLFTLQKGQFQKVKLQKDIDLKMVSNVFNQGDYVWITSDHGLFRAKFKQGEVLEIKEFTKLGGKDLSRFIIWGGFAHENTIWLTHNKGISRYNINTKHLEHYGFHQGFILMETNAKALALTENRFIWSGTVNGLHIADIHFKDYQPTKPIVSIREVQVNDEAVSRNNTSFLNFGKSLSPAPESFKVEYDHNDLKISFEAVDFDVSEIGYHSDTSALVLYSYLLEGYNKGFTKPSPQNWAAFTNLSPGDYAFKIKAKNLAGLWSDEVKMQFTIYPPFWQTWWFYILEVVLLVSLLSATIYTNRSPEKSRITGILSILTILVIFEIVNALIDPYLENFAGGVPVFRLIMNILMAGLLKPLEEQLERYLAKRRETAAPAIAAQDSETTE